jgi:haloalkane dehalogenase
MEFLKTNNSQFSRLSDYPFDANYLEFKGMQMHYIDEKSGELFLALHGEPSWSYLYRKFVGLLPGTRFIAPDLIGFGKSDKLLNWEDYSFEFHFDSLSHFIQKLNLENINLIVQDWGGLLGLSLLGAYPERFKRVIIMNTFLPKGKKLPISFRLWQLFAKHHPSLPVSWIMQKLTVSELSKETLEAYKMPYPDKSYKGSVKAFPQLVPSNLVDPAVPYLLRAREVLSEWNKPALVMFSDKDSLFSGIEKFFLNLIPYCKNQPRIIIKNAGHFLQEDKAEEICHYIRLFLEDKLPR